MLDNKGLNHLNCCFYNNNNFNYCQIAVGMDVEMQYYNNVRKIDLNGEVFQSITFEQPIIQKGKMGPLNANKNVLNNEEENRNRAIRRAKTNITDYIKTNVDLNNFVTYTLDPSKINRYDEKIIYEKMRNWLSDRVKRKKLKYILVPELHKDGAWHFHGFVNISLEWNYGFYLTKEIESARQKNNDIRYVTSYVKKDMVKFNGRRYLHSNNLNKPVKLYNNVDFDSEEGKCVELKDLGVKMKIGQG